MPPQEPQAQSSATSQAPVNEVAQQPAVVSPQPTANVAVPSKKRMPTWLKVIIAISGVILALIIAAVVAAFSATKAPQKISDQFVNHIQAGDTRAAYALTSDVFRQAATQEQLDDLTAQIGPVLQGEERVTGRYIQKSTGSPPAASLVYEVKTSNGTKYMRVVLQKNADVWQVSNFRSSDTPLEADIE